MRIAFLSLMKDNLDEALNRKLERSIAKLKADNSICKQNRDTILAFINTKTNLSVIARVTYINHMSYIIKYFHDIPLKKITSVQFNEFLAHMDKQIKPRTYNTRLKTYRQFFKTFLEKENVVKLSKKKNNIQPKHHASDLITFDQFRQILNSCKLIRDRAIIHVLWETGMRIGELQRLQLKDVFPEEAGFTLVIRKSKSMARERLILEGRDDLASWLEQHPYKDNPEAPLFLPLRLKNNMHYLARNTITEIIESTVREAGINRHITPHLFRKSRASFLSYHRKWPNPLIEKAMGWAPSSKILSDYVRLSKQDVKDQQLKDMGLRVEESDPTSWTCLFCGYINSAVNSYCKKCSKTYQTAKDIIEKKKSTEERLAKMESQMTSLMTNILKSQGYDIVKLQEVTK